MVFFPIHLLIIAMSHDNKYNLILWANYTCKELIIKKKITETTFTDMGRRISQKKPLQRLGYLVETLNINPSISSMKKIYQDKAT